jgi:hypothetical protein
MSGTASDAQAQSSSAQLTSSLGRAPAQIPEIFLESLYALRLLLEHHPYDRRHSLVQAIVERSDCIGQRAVHLLLGEKDRPRSPKQRAPRGKA